MTRRIALQALASLVPELDTYRLALRLLTADPSKYVRMAAAAIVGDLGHVLPAIRGDAARVLLERLRMTDMRSRPPRVRTTRGIISRATGHRRGRGSSGCSRTVRASRRAVRGGVEAEQRSSRVHVVLSAGYRAPSTHLRAPSLDFTRDALSEVERARYGGQAEHRAPSTEHPCVPGRRVSYPLTRRRPHFCSCSTPSRHGKLLPSLLFAP
jgi:hypothetical protein